VSTNATAPPMNDVLRGYLHSSGNVGAAWHKSCEAQLGYDMAGPRRLGQLADVTCGPLGIPEGRNDLCKALLSGECEWLWMIDDDMGFEPWVLDMLLSIADPVDRPIVGGLCFAQRESIPDGMNGMRCFPRPTILDWVPDAKQFQGRAHYPVNTLIKAGATGGAMVLIHRSVVERVKAEYGETWFLRVQDPTGAWQGEDVSFFTRTQSLEIPLFIHTGIRTTHYKHLWLAEEDFWTSFIAPPATERVDVIVPALHRPQNVKPLMDSLRASTGLATAWWVCEPDDEEEIAVVRENGGEVLVCPRAGSERPGTFAEKVNIAYALTEAPWLLLVGDDVRFRPGWLDHAQDVARRYGSKVVGTNDLCNPRVARGEHATHPMIRRSYIDEQGASWDGPGIVCHEGYRHVFVDDELVTVAKQRDTFQAALASQVEHLHPLAGKGADDEVYRLGQKHFGRDKALFARRLKAHTLDDAERPGLATADRPQLELVKEA
jgi:hypothetical protein